MTSNDLGGQQFDAADVSRQAEAAANTPGDQIVTDPVCGRKLDKRQVQYTANYLGRDQGWNTYYFDSDECKQLFESNPQQYVKSA